MATNANKFLNGPAQQTYRDPVQIQLNSPSTTPGYINDPSASGTSSNFLVRYQGTQTLTYPKDTEFCLDKFSYVNSVYNITAASGNNKIGYNVNGGTTTIFTIPDGNYGVADISAFLQNAITTNGGVGSNISLTVNLINIRTVLFLSAGYQLDLSQGTLWEQLGASGPLIYTVGGEFPQYTNIFQVNALMVQIPNLVPSFTSMINGNSSSSIYTSFITVAPGFNQFDVPVVKTWIPLGINTIQNITVNITDQNGNPVSLNGQPVNIVLRFRQKPKNSDD